MRFLARRLRDDRGVSALELAFIAPSLLLLIFFIVQLAFFLYGRSVALQTAREGVSQLRLEQTTDDYVSSRQAIEANVRQFAANVGSGALENTVVTSKYNDADGTVTVTVTGATISLTGFTLHITETATGRIERFRDFR